LQKRIAGSLAAPHVAQVRARVVPQLPQKRDPAGFSVPQFKQLATSAA
jgi:hypothetical protein